MKCLACGLENPPSAARCDCGNPITKQVQVVPSASMSAPPRSKSAIRFVWLAPLLGALVASAELASNWDSQKSAPQQAALAGFALALAVIPYCLARAVSGLAGK